MSWSISKSSMKREDLGESFNNSFESSYTEASDGVKEQYSLARHCVDVILDGLEVDAEDIVNSVTISGHAALGESDQNTVSVYVSAPATSG